MTRLAYLERKYQKVKEVILTGYSYLLYSQFLIDSKISLELKYEFKGSTWLLYCQRFCVLLAAFELIIVILSKNLKKFQFREREFGM